jgi:hypothetical protein
LIAEAEKARFWKRLTVRRAANMMMLGEMSKGRRSWKGKEEIPVKEIGWGLHTTWAVSELPMLG